MDLEAEIKDELVDDFYNFSYPDSDAAVSDTSSRSRDGAEDSGDDLRRREEDVLRVLQEEGSDAAPAGPQGVRPTTSDDESDDRHRRRRLKRWCFTSFRVLWDPDRRWEDYLNGEHKLDQDLNSWWSNLAAHEGVERLCGQLEECPTSGRIHFQGYVVLRTSQRFNWVQQRIPGHLFGCNGSEPENVTYCTKHSTRYDGPWFFPSEQAFSRTEAQGSSGRYFEALRRGQRPRVLALQAEEAFGYYIRNQRALDEVYEEVVHRWRPRGQPPTVIVLCGAPGIGKSRLAHQLAERFRSLLGYDKYYSRTCLDRYFHGYNCEEIAILDEFDPAIIPHRMFNSLCDRYPTSVPVFYGMRQWCAEIIIVCTNIHVVRWYPSTDIPLRTVLRRITSNLHMLAAPRNWDEFFEQTWDFLINVRPSAPYPLSVVEIEQ